MTTMQARTLCAATAFAATLAAAGCGSVRYPTHYVMSLDAPTSASHVREGVGTVAVNALHCPDYICEGRIVYRPAPAEVAFYQFHRWAVSPREMISQYLVERVRAGSIFSSVSGSGAESHVSPHFVLNGSIDQLEEVDEPHAVVAACSVSLRLLDAATGALVWSGAVTERVPVARRDVPGVVDGLTMAVRTSVDRLVSEMAHDLERSN